MPFSYSLMSLCTMLSWHFFIIICTHSLTLISFFLYSPIHTFIFHLWSHVSRVSHISPKPACPPVCRWQLKIISVTPKHPIVHGRCQVPCRHGNYAEFSGCPVDIYRPEKPTLNLAEMAELGWALCLCQITAMDHRVLNRIMCQVLRGIFRAVHEYISHVATHLHTDSFI